MCAVCESPALPSAPAPLCQGHLVAVHEWVTEHSPAPDRSPAPCPLCGAQLGVRLASGWVCAVCEWPAGSFPDGELPPPRIDVVYYIRFGDRIKIGTSANPRRRLGALWHDELLAFERGDRVIEHRRHLQFAGSRIDRSEWFERTPELDQHVDGLRSLGDPWRLHARWIAEATAALA